MQQNRPTLQHCNSTGPILEFRKSLIHHKTKHNFLNPAQRYFTMFIFQEAPKHHQKLLDIKSLRSTQFLNELEMTVRPGYSLISANL